MWLPDRTRSRQIEELTESRQGEAGPKGHNGEIQVCVRMYSFDRKSLARRKRSYFGIHDVSR